VRLPAGYSVRPAELSDLDAVVDLLKATDRADAGVEDPVREHLLLAWERQASFSLERDTSLVLAADGKLAAYANIEGSHPETSLEVWVRVHPDHRGRGLGSALLDWGEALSLERSPNLPVLRDAIPHEDTIARDLLERRGFAHVRTFWHMLRDLDGPIEDVPTLDGVEIRRYEHPRDVRTLHEVLEEAFREHWGTEPYPYEDHEREMATWDRDLAWLAVADDSVVAAALGTSVEGSGWVDVLGVLEPWRRKGVGRALLLTQFRMFAARGAPNVALNVDSGNDTGAPSLYVSAGMRVHRAWDVFEKRFAGAEPG
jgi:mycothiol synthase